MNSKQPFRIACWLLWTVAFLFTYCSCKRPLRLSSSTALPEGTITIPLLPDTSYTAKHIYSPCPINIRVDDSTTQLIQKHETFLHILKDSCWMEHVCTGTLIVNHRDGRISNLPMQQNETVPLGRIPALNH